MSATKRERQRVEQYSRVVGFLTPLSQWNKGKQEEFKDRVAFNTHGRVASE